MWLASVAAFFALVLQGCEEDHTAIMTITNPCDPDQYDTNADCKEGSPAESLLENPGNECCQCAGTGQEEGCMQQEGEGTDGAHADGKKCPVCKWHSTCEKADPNHR